MPPVPPCARVFCRLVGLAAGLLSAVFAAGCGGETGFSGARARDHVRMLAGTIGSRPAGSDANRRAREYVVGELRAAGFQVRIQAADASRPELGQTTRVFNVIGVRPGTSADAVALVTHYDSPPESRGAADDGLGSAVVLEAARVLAQRADPRWTLVVALTDAEELGLMGAAALVHDPVMMQVRAYLNLEAVGTTGPSLLFQTGPGNAWLVKAWAAAAPAPAGNSITTEIYERLPNDTDFSVIRHLGIPGLNFAPVGYSEAYHTPRDTAANLSDATLQTTGDNAVAIVRALDAIDIRQRAPFEHATYFDIGERVAVVYGPRPTAILAGAAAAIGFLTWLKVLAAGRKIAGLARLLLGFAWALVTGLATVLAMIAITWSLRAASGWLHPWYARPGVFLLLLATGGLTAWWSVGRLLKFLPERFHACSDPACQWAVGLPLWVLLTLLLYVSAPGAGFVLAWPLLVAAVGIPLALSRPNRVRPLSLAVLVVSALLTLPSAIRLLFFASPMFGRLPFVMPIYVYPALMAAFAIPLLPPLVAATPPAVRRACSSRAMGVALAFATVAAFVAAWSAAGYSSVRPHLRGARYLNAAAVPGQPAVEYWEVGGNERTPSPLLPGSPGTAWRRVQEGPPVNLPLGRLRRAFVDRLQRPASEPFPGQVSATVTPGASGTLLAVRVVPASPTATVLLVLPAGVKPASSNYPGRVLDGHWRAAYIAAPPSGVEFRVGLETTDARQLSAAYVAIADAGLPGGAGWQKLPSWLPQERDAWTARSIFVAGLGLEGAR